MKKCSKCEEEKDHSEFYRYGKVLYSRCKVCHKQAVKESKNPNRQKKDRWIITVKERELIRLKSEGRTVQQMAKALISNRRYVSQMLNDLYKKTGCINGPQLVSWAYQNNILEINCQKLPITKVV